LARHPCCRAEGMMAGPVLGGVAGRHSIVDRDRNIRIGFPHGGLRDRGYPAPPVAEATDIWIVEFESGRVVFKASPVGSVLQSLPDRARRLDRDVPKTARGHETKGRR
jgi:hypothetical protein